ncbi:hypothetical protein H5410_026138 [Solanum commersonii]|uniref:Uncharacterized protein n=1 Tax=Solanum commersonii TaxID=4109 RepID=A0A9J5Z0L7_SOLCO|nr:hypothetical protein H5410_026138 [Solanum commersonii]
MGSNGKAYTWNDKGTTNRVFSKIDWSFINGAWVDEMPDCRTTFMNEGGSVGKEVPRCLMYQLMQKLKMLKTEIRKLHTQHFAYLLDEVRWKLQVAQNQLQAHPSNKLKQHEFFSWVLEMCVIMTFGS